SIPIGCPRKSSRSTPKSMPRSNKPGAPSFADAVGEGARQAARTQLNHIVGYGEVMRQDAIEAGRDDLASIFATICESAQALKVPLLARLSGEAESGPQ